MQNRRYVQVIETFIILIFIVLLTACQNQSKPNALKSDDITSLSDEFSDSTTTTNWKTAEDLVKEGGKEEVSFLETSDINQTSKGNFYLLPQTGTWYQNRTGQLSYKEISGDFIATMKVKVTGKTGPTPKGSFELAGMMVRVPSQKAGVPAELENWEYLTSDDKQIDYKTTRDSNSVYEIVDASSEWKELRIARIGSTIIKLYRLDGGKWKIAETQDRPDFPLKLQVGICLLTDFNGGKADIISYVDYFRFQRPNPEKNIAQKIQTKTMEKNDWLAFLGA